MNDQALFRITYGLYLLSTRVDGKDNACIINTAMQVAEHPVRIAVSVLKKNLTHDMIAKASIINLSAISTEADFALFQRFGMQSGRDADKFAGFHGVARSANGLYYLTQGACAYLSAKVVDSVDLGTHTILIAEVTDGDVLSSASGCTYGYYQSHIKPKPAVKPSSKKRWVCKVCGYVYEGDELPDDYLCPLCKHGKADFEPMPAEPAPGPVKKCWVCKVCGYVYEGDELPEDYLCPLCKHGKADFEPMEVSAAPEPEKKPWVCKVCGYIHEDGEPPEDFICPLCKRGKENFAPME